MPYVITTLEPDPDDVAAGCEMVSTRETRHAVATLEERLVFDPREWGGKDQGDNSQFWHNALILRRYRSDGNELADVLFLHDGRESTGHFTSAMKPVVESSFLKSIVLSNETTIEVRPVLIENLIASAGIQAQYVTASRYADTAMTDADVIDAYNAFAARHAAS